MHLQRQRYILFEYEVIDVTSSFTEKEIIRSIWSSMISLFGEYNSYFSGLWMIKYDQENHWGIVRCTNRTKEQVITALAFISEIKRNFLIFHTIKTSGTIKKIQKIQKEFFSKNRE